MATPFASGNQQQLSPFSSPANVSQAQLRPSGPAVVPSQPQTAVPQTAINVSPTKQVNVISLCRSGQEIVQEILSKTSDIFQYLRTMQLPNGMNITPQQFQERKVKLDESVRYLDICFRRLRSIYDTVNDATATLESRPIEDLLPINESDGAESKKLVAKYSTEEERELAEQIELRNCQMKEVIDMLRTVIWEINTMMAMRKTYVP